MEFFFGCFGSPKKKSGRKRRKLSGKSPQKKSRLKQVELHDNPTPCVQRKVVVEPIAVEKDLGFISYKIENVVVVVEKPKKKVKFDPNVTTYDYEAVDSVFESLDAQGSLSSSFVFPVNHRYQDWTFNDDDNVQEYLDDDFDDDDDEDDCSTDLHEEVEEEDESFDSYFSLQMDKVQQDLEEIGTVNPDDIMMKPKGKEGAARDRSYVHSVLIPVENLSQWKEAKGKKIMHPKNSAKENIESALPILVPIYDD